MVGLRSVGISVVRCIYAVVEPSILVDADSLEEVGKVEEGSGSDGLIEL